MHLESSKVCIMTRSTLASLLFKGLATKHTAVKWTILGTVLMIKASLYDSYGKQLLSVRKLRRDICQSLL